MAKGKGPPKLEDLVANLSDGALECRDLRHSWHTVICFHTKSMGGAVGRRLICTRCQTVKTEYINRSTGEIVARSYRYEPGYQIKGASGIYKPFEITRQAHIAVLATLKIEEVEEE